VGRYISFPVLLVVVILQSTVVPYFRVAGGGPDLILMVVLSWMMLAGLEEGLVWQWSRHHAGHRDGSSYGTTLWLW